MVKRHLMRTLGNVLTMVIKQLWIDWFSLNILILLNTSFEICYKLLKELSDIYYMYTSIN